MPLMEFNKSEATAAKRRLPFRCIDATGAGKTGLTFSGSEIQVSKNGAAFGDFAGSASELAGGWYYYEFTQSELNTTGFVGLKVVKSGVKQVDEVAVVRGKVALEQLAIYPVSGDDAISIVGTGTGRVLYGLAGATAGTSVLIEGPSSGSGPVVKLSALTAGAALHLDGQLGSPDIIALEVGPTLAVGQAQSGTSTTIRLAATASATDDLFNNQRVSIIEGTGAGQSQRVTDYDGTTKDATIAGTWVVTPDNTSRYIITPGAEAQVTVTGGDATLANQTTILGRIGNTGGTDLDALLDAIKAKTDALTFTGSDVKATLDGEAVAISDKTGFALSSAGLDSITVHGINLRKLIAYAASVLHGKLSGAELTGSHQEVFKGPDGSTTLVTVTVDDDGNRTAVTLNATVSS